MQVAAGLERHNRQSANYSALRLTLTLFKSEKVLLHKTNNAIPHTSYTAQLQLRRDFWMERGQMERGQMFLKENKCTRDQELALNVSYSIAVFLGKTT